MVPRSTNNYNIENGESSFHRLARLAPQTQCIEWYPRLNSRCDATTELRHID